MLVCLHIENIAVIEKADVEFDKGFCVLTGETGAGKSILIDSINAVLGERTSKELIRSGCEKAVVSAVFSDISNDVTVKLTELGFESHDNELMISRILTESKSVAKINGQIATAAMIRELAPLLINIHGQHDSQDLLVHDKQYIYIDLLAENKNLLEAYQDEFTKMQNTRRRLKQLTQDLEDKEKRIELLSYQASELERAGIKVGELNLLKSRQAEINNAEKIITALQSAYTAISGDGSEESISAISLSDIACAQLMSINNYSKQASDLYNMLYNAKDKLQEVKDGLYQLISNFDFDKNELEEVEERLDMFYRLSMKYGDTEEKMLEFYDSIKSELNSIIASDDEYDKLQSVLLSQVEAVKISGANLTKSRNSAGEKFAKDVAQQLEFLDMPNVKIVVDITERSYSKLGADSVELLISTNPGETPKPLSKIASGGEMSRIMLAIKNVLAKEDPVDTLIFDEIDTGVSGRAAQKVGYKLKETANGKQVICVTHLAQIAALADTHFLIEKRIENNRAVTTITPLDFEGRKHELARIIGSDITENNLKSAEEMLKARY